MLWSRVSKAFERSRKIFSGLFLLSIFVMILSVSSSAACSVECPERKPYWWSNNSLCLTKFVFGTHKVRDDLQLSHFVR